MNRFAGVLLLATIVGCGSAKPSMPVAKPITFDFQGMKFGDPLPEKRDRWDVVKVKGDRISEYSLVVDVEGIRFDVILGFADGKFYRFLSSTPGNKFDLLVKSYSEKFGRGPDREINPSKESSDFPSRIWRTTAGDFEIQQVSEFSTNCSLYSPAYDRISKELDQQEQAKQAEALKSKL